MVIKTVTNADTGTADIVGGDDWDAMATIVNNNYAPFVWVIVKDGSTYYARNQVLKTVPYTGATLDPVLTSVLSAATITPPSDHFGLGTPQPGGGDIYVGGGRHTLSGSFAGWTVPSLCTLKYSANARVEVPAGYTGFVHKFITLPSPATSAGQLSRVEGGYFTEAGTPSRLWTAFLIAPDSGNGIAWDSIKNVTITKAGKGIHLRVDNALGWSTVNIFEDIRIHDTGINVLFDYNGQTPSVSGNGFHRNLFMSVTGQASANTNYGFKDIHGTNNLFINCQVSDLLTYNPSGISANITADAINTFIFGGSMTGSNYADLGQGTFVFDNLLGYVHKSNVATNSAVPETIGPVRITGLSLQTPIIAPFSNSTSNITTTFKQYNDANYSVDISPFSDSRTTTINLYNNSVNERFFMQKNLSSSFIFASQKISSGGTVLPIIFETIDTPGVGTLESFRINADSTVKFTGATQDENYKDEKVITIPGDPASGYTRRYSKAIDANNDGHFVKRKVNGAVVEILI